jgi:hypothetical protein
MGEIDWRDALLGTNQANNAPVVRREAPARPGHAAVSAAYTLLDLT